MTRVIIHVFRFSTNSSYELAVTYLRVRDVRVGRFS